MARKYGDTESGKLGNKIYYTWHGRQCERAMPTHVANPQTEAQQSHRSNFALISKLSSYMKDAHLVGLHWLSVREHNSTYALFRKLNKDCFTPDGLVNLPRIIVSKGSVPLVAINAAKIENGVLTVTFDSRHYGGDPTDELYLFVYCPALCTGRRTSLRRHRHRSPPRRMAPSLPRCRHLPPFRQPRPPHLRLPPWP